MKFSIGLILTVASIIILGLAFALPGIRADALAASSQKFGDVGKNFYTAAYSFPIDTLSFELIESSTDPQFIVINKSTNEKISLDLYNFPESNLKLMFEGWQKSTLISDSKFKYLPPLSCKFLAIHAYIDKVTRFQTINNFTSSDSGGRVDANRGIKCISSITNELENIK